MWMQIAHVDSLFCRWTDYGLDGRGYIPGRSDISPLHGVHPPTLLPEGYLIHGFKAAGARSWPLTYI
jgi:hypothetical protein